MRPEEACGFSRKPSASRSLMTLRMVAGRARRARGARAAAGGDRLAGLDVVLDQRPQDLALAPVELAARRLAWPVAPRRYGSSQVARGAARPARGSGPPASSRQRALGRGAVAGLLGQQGLEVAPLLAEGEDEARRAPVPSSSRSASRSAARAPSRLAAGRRPAAPARRAARGGPGRGRGPPRGRRCAASACPSTA